MCKDRDEREQQGEYHSRHFYSRTLSKILSNNILKSLTLLVLLAKD